MSGPAAPATGTVASVVGGATGASAIGASHAARRLPNQDSVGWRQSRLWTFVAVADGHGSAPHPRSDRGSRFAVDALLELFGAATRDGALREPDALARILPGLPGRLVALWRARVAADIAADPVPEAPGFASDTLYGSTCLGAAVGPGLSLMVQIGDGDLFAGPSSGDVARVFAEDELEGEQTYSLCLPDAERHVKTALFTAPTPLCAPDFLLAATDGFAKSFGDAAGVLDVVRHYRRAVMERGLDAVAAELGPWLARCSAMGSGDDTSVAIFAAARGAGGDAPTPSDPPPGRARPPAARRSPAGLTMAAAVLGGLVGGMTLDRWAVPFVSRIVGSDAATAPPPQPSPIPLDGAPAAPAVQGPPAPPHPVPHP